MNVKHVYYRNSPNNFGDLLNIDYFRKLSNIEAVYTNRKQAEVIAIGSLLSGFYSRRWSLKRLMLFLAKPLIVWGSGFIKDEENNEKLFRRLDVRAVRGYHTLSRIKDNPMVEIAENVAVGDPGLLVPKLFNVKHIKKRYKLGIVPHFIDNDNALLNNIKVDNSIVINVLSDSETFINKLAQCEFILSSSLHGLVTADSLSIPNVRMIVSGKVKGGDYKYDDYYSVFGIEHHDRVFLNESSFTDRDISQLKDKYCISEEKVKDIQYRLLQTYPYELTKPIQEILAH